MEIRFDGARFTRGEIDFTVAVMGGVVSFRRAEFAGGNVDFGLAQFTGGQIERGPFTSLLPGDNQQPS